MVFFGFKKNNETEQFKFKTASNFLITYIIHGLPYGSGKF